MDGGVTLTGTTANTTANFGTAVAIDGDTLVVGADSDPDPNSGLSVGAAYVFTRTNGVWTLQQRLSPAAGSI
jgi:FG-GAP repeat